jgi:Tfp pilus assembly protein PilO
MKGSDKAVVLGVVMAVVLIGFYVMVLSPKRDKASQLDKDVADLKSQVSKEQQVAQFGEQARQQFPVFYGRLVVLGKAVPAEADTASLLVQLSAIARRTDVDFRGITLAAGSGDSSSTASSSAETTTPTTTTGTSTTSTTSTTPAPSGSSDSSSAAPASSTTAPTTVAAPATEAGAANLPIGASVGPGDLGAMPYNLNFVGNYFQVADFLQGLDGLIHTHGNTQVAADGRLLTIDAFSLSDPRGTGSNPKLTVAISVTSYVTPASQGLTAGATPGGPAPSLTQPQTQPASATVSP